MKSEGGVKTKAPAKGNGAKTSTVQFKKSENLYAQIQQKAYEIYLNRGGQDGRDMDDWLEAERSILGRN